MKITRIVAISDTHGAYKPIEQMFSKFKADVYVHCGDGYREADLFRKSGEFHPLVFVRGNCDVGCPEPTERELDIDGKKIYITHGHRHYVKSGMSDLYDLAERKGYSAVFFGHTHSPVCSYFKGTWFLNPGSAGMPYDGKPKAAVLDITDTGVFGFLTELN